MRRLTLFLTLLLTLATWAQTPADTLYQVSTFNALAQGLYGGSATVADVLAHGDTGLGTFEGLDGEMIVLDGVCYQVTVDGVVHVAPGTAVVPFAQVTAFAPGAGGAAPAGAGLPELQTLLDGALVSPNLIHVVKVTGTFARVKVRSVPKQAAPYPPLAEVVKRQATFELTNVHGTLIGIRGPAFLAGVGVAGYHFHFLTDDRRAGGHALEATVAAATYSIGARPNLLLAAPATEAYRRADLTTADAEAARKAE